MSEKAPERIWLTKHEADDLIETLLNAAGELDTEGLGDGDSCISARRWAKRLKEETIKRGGV